MADDALGDAGSRSRGEPPITPRRIALFVVAAILIVVAVLNLDQVSIDLVVGSIRMPLIAMLAVAGGVGFLAGWWFFRRRERRQRTA